MSGPRSSVDVFLRLYGQRNFSRELAKSGAELEALGLKGAKAMSRFAASGEKLKRFGKSWTHNVSMPVAALGIGAAGMAAQFDRSMSLISTQAGGSAKEVKGLEKAVLNMHNQFTPNERAQGLFYIESAGLRGKKAMEMLQANIELATAGNSDLEHTVFGTVGAMNALGKEGKNFTRIASIMNSTVGHGHMRMEELVGAISTGLVGAAKSFGVSWAGMNSAIAFFTRMGEPAQQVATRLRQTITHLATNASTKGAEALDSIGMSTEKMGARIRKSGRIGPVIKELAEHLNAVGKTKADQVLTDAFGGGRFGTQIREATQRWQLLLKTEREVGKFGTAKKLKGAFKEAENQPLVKLKETWGDISAILVKLGNEVLPEAVPGLQKLAHFVGSATHAFMGLPGPVKAATVGFLLLTGPIASGLGYFANGIGRALILTTKLARAAKDMQIFGSALQAGQGLKGSAAMAFGTYGESAAMQTAKGFAVSLGPAVAAYGIGNILTSALSGDWKDAGFEAGGAIAGGIAGFMLGGPMGAMLGVGIGSLGGELLSGLFSSSPKVSLLRRETEHLTAATGSYKESLGGLKHIEARLDTTKHRHLRAIREEREASHHLSHVLAQYGVNSGRATRAQRRLSEAQRKVTHTAKAEARLSQLAGFRLKEFRIQSLHAVASIKQLLPTQKRRIKTMREEVNHGRTGIKFLKELEGLEKRVGKEKRQLTGIYAEAEAKAGAPWAKRLQGLTSSQAKYGRQGKVLIQRISETKEKMHILASTGMKTTKGYEKQMEALAGLRRQYEKINELGVPKSAESVEGHAPHRARPGEAHRGARHRNTANPARGRRAQAQRLQIAPGSLSGALDIHLTSHHVIELEGKPIAEETTRQVKRKQLLE